MSNTTQTSALIQNFIETIWNTQHFGRMDEFMHPAFTDHSLPPAFPTDKIGLKQWIKTTGQSFDHHTSIEEQVSEKNTCIIKIRMDLTHIGTWRNINATHKRISVTGYRCFKIKEYKIIAHWALIDGNAIENLLKEAGHGCKVQE